MSPHSTDPSNTETSTSHTPSPEIDAAICDLMAALSNYSNEWFDTQWMNLTEEDLVAIVVLLLKELPHRIDGRVLGRVLLEAREGRGEVASLAERSPTPGNKPTSDHAISGQG